MKRQAVLRHAVSKASSQSSIHYFISIACAILPGDWP
jgi:hypothetical protein